MIVEPARFGIRELRLTTVPTTHPLLSSRSFRAHAPTGECPSTTFCRLIMEVAVRIPGSSIEDIAGFTRSPPQLELMTRDGVSWLSPPSDLKSLATSISPPLILNTTRAPSNELQLSFKEQDQIACLWLDESVLPIFNILNVLFPHYRRKVGI